MRECRSGIIAPHACEPRSVVEIGVGAAVINRTLRQLLFA
jgi:hypothetical protein